MTQSITVTITPDGMKIEAAGFEGGKCIVAQDELEKFLVSSGISITGKDQKRKLEVSYEKAPGNTVKY